MSLKLLRAYLTEAVSQVINESEVYVDENGYAHDDEGNSWYVGKGGAGGVYKASTFGRSRYGGGRSSGGAGSYSSQPKPPRASADAAQVAAIQKLAAARPGSNFVMSIKTQVERGGNLSPKQKAVVVQMLQSAGMTAEAALFV